MQLLQHEFLLLLLLPLSFPLSHNKRPRKGGTENKGANTRSGECSNRNKTSKKEAFFAMLNLVGCCPIINFLALVLLQNGFAQ